MQNVAFIFAWISLLVYMKGPSVWVEGDCLRLSTKQVDRVSTLHVWKHKVKVHST